MVPTAARAAPATTVALLDIEIADAPGPAELADELAPETAVPVERSFGADTGGSDEEGDGGVSGALIAAVILGVLLLCFVLLTLLLCILLLRAQARNAKGSADQKPENGSAVAKAGLPAHQMPVPVAAIPAALPWDNANVNSQVCARQHVIQSVATLPAYADKTSTSPSLQHDNSFALCQSNNSFAS